jgi:hypothetical protein
MLFEVRLPVKAMYRVDPYIAPGVTPYVYPPISVTIVNSGAGGGLVSDNLLPGPILP